MNKDKACKHIGIVACSAEGAALCYRTICSKGSEFLGPHAHPEISMHTPSLADYVRLIEMDDWLGVGDLMLDSVDKLANAGAEFVICPDNTIHQALSFIEKDSKLPWLHIAEVVATEALRLGYKTIGLTGTCWLVESEVYPQQLLLNGLEFIRPEREQREEIGRIIMDELVYADFKPESVAYFQSVIDYLKHEGCDAVVLGCTEIPLIINDSNSSLPTLNSTVLLAQAALKYAIAE